MNAVARLDQPFLRRQRGIRSCFIIGLFLRVVTLLGTIRHPGALPVLLPPSILLYSVSKARSAPGAQLMIAYLACAYWPILNTFTYLHTNTNTRMHSYSYAKAV